MSNAKKFAIGTLFVLFVIILLQNTHIITLDILFWTIETPTFFVPLVIVLSVTVGYFMAKVPRKNNKKDDLDDF